MPKTTMKAVAVFCLIVTAHPSILSAADLSLPKISVDRLFIDGGRYRAIYRITNNTGPKGFRVIGIECTFMRGGLAVDTAGTVEVNVSYGDTVFGKVTGPTNSQAVDEVNCRVEYATE